MTDRVQEVVGQRADPLRCGAFGAPAGRSTISGTGIVENPHGLSSQIRHHDRAVDHIDRVVDLKSQLLP